MPDFGLGGTQRVVSLLVPHWSEANNVILVTLASFEKDFYPLPCHITRIGLGLSTNSRTFLHAIIANIKRIIALRKIIRKHKPTVIISFLESTNVLSILARVATNTRLIVCVRADPKKQAFNKYWRMAQKILYKFSDKVTTNNREVENWLQKYVPKNKVVYIPNPIKILPQKKTNRQKQILFVGRLHAEKGCDLLIKAFSHTALPHKGWQLIFVGSGPEKDSLKELIKNLTLESSVLLLGEKTRVADFYLAAEIFVMPSRHEGMPNALLEAMSFGLPVIVSNSSASLLEYVTPEYNGLVFNNENIEELAKSLEMLAFDNRLRKTLGENAANKLKQNDFRAVVAQWQMIL